MLSQGTINENKGEKTDLYTAGIQFPSTLIHFSDGMCVSALHQTGLQCVSHSFILYFMLLLSKQFISKDS